MILRGALIVYGIVRGREALIASKELKAAFPAPDLHNRFLQALDFYVDHFEQDHLLDTYAFCFSRHNPDDRDGLLSMWRGYGGNGRGAAILFDAGKIPKLDGGPLIIAKVEYGSDNERVRWLTEISKRVGSFLQTKKVGEWDVARISKLVFDRLKMFALFTKHVGFSEEREWRLVYMSDRDPDKRLAHALSFFNGPRGVEPKLKLRLGPIPGVVPTGLEMSTLISQILLGPTTSSKLASRSVTRMLEKIAPPLAERVTSSTIPFRNV